MLLRDGWRLERRKFSFNVAFVIVLSNILVSKGGMEGGAHFFAL